MNGSEQSGHPANRAVDLFIRLAALGLLAAWCIILLGPFIATILWGGILAIALRPLQLSLARMLGGREGLASTLLTILGLVVILGPVSVLAASLVSGGEALALAFAEGRLAPPPPPDWLLQTPFVGEKLHAAWRLASENLMAATNHLAPQMGEVARTAIGYAGAAGLTVLQFAAAIVIAGVLMPRALSANDALARLADRLAPARGAAFVTMAAQTVRNVARGVIGVALLQGLLMGVGFLAAGIPYPGVWTFVCVVLAIVQVGPGLIGLGTIIYAWNVFDVSIALPFTIWIVLASLVDNVLKPVLMSKGLPTPMVVILLGLLGGALAHGLIGLFVGPIVLALGYDLMRVWMDEDPAAGDGEGASRGG
jgi:predicted PurR-regulated permease PerM